MSDHRDTMLALALALAMVRYPPGAPDVEPAVRKLSPMVADRLVAWREMQQRRADGGRA
jgi:hypothetical protein